jgi:hypothetical protein
VSVLLDEESVVLEGLDFEVPCEVVGSTGPCAQHAEFEMKCVQCGDTCGLLCLSRAVYARSSNRPVRHVTCGVSGPLCDIVTVVPL